MASRVKPYVPDIRKFKDFFHHKMKATFQTFSKNRGGKQKPINFSGRGNKKTLNKLIHANVNDRMDVGMMIGRSGSGSRSASAVDEIGAVFIDRDKGELTRKQLMALPLPPHLIVDTSPDNFHAYWLVKGCSVDHFKPVQKALASTFGTDANVCDASRVMRVPGTINWKRDKPFLASITHIDEGARPISLDRFVRKMNLNVDLPNADTSLTAGDTTIGMAAKREMTPELNAEIEAALDGLPADDRWMWQRVGMAINSVDNSAAGYEIWTRWSRTSSKFDEKDQRARWTQFKAIAAGGVNLNTLFWLAKDWKKSGNFAYDEMRLAHVFAKASEHCLRYERESEQWYHFTGVIWRVDKQAPVRQAHSFIEGLCDGEKGDAAEYLKHYRTTTGMRSIVNHAAILDEMLITPEEFDTDSNLLATKNGVIDLLTGKFRAAAKDDYLRRQVSVEFDPNAKCPIWISFLKEVTCQDRDLYEFIRRAVGYTMFGHANLQIFFVLVGSGGNGKGVLVRTFQKVLGNYALSVAPNLLTSAFSGSANGPTPALARLDGARMVVCTELPSKKGFDEAFIKQYAGGDEIVSRQGYGQMFASKPEGKLWLSTNDLPEIRAADDAMWRRLKPIPFHAKFRGETVDPKLEQKLANEYPGILNWALEGATQYSSDGLGSCSAVDRLQTRMRMQSDSVLAWLSECCVEKSDVEIQSSTAYDSYLLFAQKSERKALSTAAFRISLEGKGFHHHKRRKFNVFEGLSLRKNR